MNTNIKLLVIVLLFSIIAMIGGSVLLSKKTESKPIDVNKAIGDGRWQKGSGEAELTIVEFSDFQCSACSRATSEVERVISDFGDRVRVIYRHFPLTQTHFNAFDAAVASEITGKEGKFWEMHDMLFERQKDWADEEDAKEIFVGYVEDLGLERESFLSSFEDKSFEEKVRADIRDGRELGIAATPTFIVGGKAIYANELYNLVSGTLSKE